MIKLKKINSLALTFILLFNLISPTSFAIEPNEICHGFKLTHKYSFMDHMVLTFEHIKTGAQLVVEKNDDPEKKFQVGFKTPPENDRGANHVLEHCILFGSKNSKIDRMDQELRKSAFFTTINGSTFPQFTSYPIASYDENELNNLARFYMEAIFNPKVLENERIFRQEGIRFELDDNENLIANGRAFNEVNDTRYFLQKQAYKFLYSSKKNRFVSGGFSCDMIDLTYQEVCDTYKKYYHPSNSLFVISGDIDYEKTLEWLDTDFLSNFEKKDMSYVNYDYTPEDSENSDENILNLKYFHEAGECHYAETFFFLDKPLTDELRFIRQINCLLKDPTSDAYKYLLSKGYRQANVQYNQLYPNTNIEIVLTSNNLDAVQADIVKNVFKELIPKLTVNTEELEHSESRRIFFETIQKYSTDKHDEILAKLFFNSFTKTNNPLSDEFFKFEGDKIVSPHEGSFSAEEFNEFITKVFQPDKIIIIESSHDVKDSISEKVKEKLSSLEPQKYELTKNYKQQQEWAKEPLSDEGFKEIKSRLVQLSNIKQPELSQKIEIEKLLLNIPTLIAQSNIGPVLKVCFFFDVSHLSEEELKYFNLFKSLFLQVSVSGKNLKTLKKDRDDKIKITSTTSAFIDVNNNQHAVHELSFLTVVNKLNNAEELFKELISSVTFKNEDDVSLIIKKAIDHCNAHIDNNALELLDEKPYYCTLESLYKSQIKCSDYIKFLNETYEKIKVPSNLEDLNNKLLNLKNKILNQNTLFASAIIASQENINLAKLVIPKVFDTLSDGPIELKTLNLEFQGPKKIIFKSLASSSDKIYQYFPICMSQHMGCYSILQIILKKLYLVPNVMYLIGSYGMNTSIHNNVMGFFSYPNPNAVKTLDVFNNCPTFLRNLDITQEQLELITKQVISENIKYAEHKIFLAENQISSFITQCNEDYCSSFQKTIDAFKNLTVEQLKSLADELEVITNESSIIIVTSKADLQLEGFTVIGEI